MLADITVNGFADDHSLRKSFPASDLGKQNNMQRKLEHTLAVIMSWMNIMRLRLNTNKMEYITFGSKAQLWKIPKKAINNWQPYNTDVHWCKIPWRNTRQPAQLQQRLNNEDMESNVKLHTYKSNREIPHQTSMHNTNTIPQYHPPWIMVMHYYMAFQKSIKRLQMVQNICAKLVLQHSSTPVQHKHSWTFTGSQLSYTLQDTNNNIQGHTKQGAKVHHGPTQTRWAEEG